MKTLKKISEVKDLAGKKVLLRLDLNVPVQNGKILDDFRIFKAMPTINLLREKGAKVIVLSHIGEDPEETLRPVAGYLNIKLLPLDFSDRVLQGTIDELRSGEVVMLENLRQNPGEISNDEGFSKTLASLGDLYVDDAFAAMHRSHASIVSVPKFLPSYIGPLSLSEVENLSRAFHPEHPFLFIIGGVKFETKLSLIKKFENLADKIFIGGALANTVFKQFGLEVGKSLVDDKNLDLGYIKNNSKFILPEDVQVVNDSGQFDKSINQVILSDNILDIGSASLSSLKVEASRAKFILWNGPLGNYEKGFSGRTGDLALAISKSKAVSIVGGGDTVASIKDLNILDKFSFVSSGGGAMLDFLANGTLPGLAALGFS